MKFQKEICIKNGKNMRARTRRQTRILTVERMRHMLHLNASQGINLVMGMWACKHGGMGVGVGVGVGVYKGVSMGVAVGSTAVQQKHEEKVASRSK